MSDLRHRKSVREKSSDVAKKSKENKKNGTPVDLVDDEKKNGSTLSRCTDNEDTASTSPPTSPEINAQLLIGSYWLSRVVFLRFLAFVYLVAFLVAYDQNKQLIGTHGLLPANSYIANVKRHFGKTRPFTAFMNVPTLFMFVDEERDLDWWLEKSAITGLLLSMLVLLKGSANMVVMFQLWLLYHSIVNVGQRWYSFGWESQLLESGFLAMFFVPLFDLSHLPSRKPSWAVLWGNRWLIFRIMMGAGLIKIRGDKCWRDLTCMEYHYQTQPVPNPFSYYLHQSPTLFHNFETLSNHFVELVAPVLLLLPDRLRKLRIIGAIIQISFQVVLILSGNLSFLNWLTILPSLACFDDSSLSCFFTPDVLKSVCEIQAGLKTKGRSLMDFLYTCIDFSVFGLIIVLSVPVVQNLLSSRQAMNTSFDSFRIVNTYGAFGSITKTRTEIIIQGTRNKTIIPDKLGGRWEEYEFHCKPGDVSRRPCIISPYHYRLDWLMWFAAFQNYQQNPWLIHLTAKLLVNDGNATSLLSHNPFAGGKPPRFIRGQHYKYIYTSIGSGSKDWWKRKLIGSYFPVVELKTLKPFLQAHEWKIPRKS